MLSSCYSETLIWNMHQRKMERMNSGCNFPCLFVVVKSSGQKKPTHKNNPSPNLPPCQLDPCYNCLVHICAFKQLSGVEEQEQHSILNTENGASLAFSSALDTKAAHSGCTSPANTVALLAILLTWHFWSPKYNGTGKRGEKSCPASSKINTVFCCTPVIKSTAKNTFIRK